MNHTTKPCACGAQLPLHQLGIHKRQCTVQRSAILAEVQRIANALGRTPYMNEYDNMKAASLPTANNVVPNYWELWNDVIMAAGLKPVRVTRERPAAPASTGGNRYWWHLEREALQAYGY